MALNTSTKWKIQTPQADETNDPALYYKNIVQNIENRAAGAAQIVATIAARTAIPTAELYEGKRVYVLADNGEYVRVGGVWLLWNRPRVAYTPTYTNFTLGNGTVTATVAISAGMATVQLRIVLGSTSVMGTNPTISLPVVAAGSLSSYGAGLCGIGAAYQLNVTASTAEISITALEFISAIRAKTINSTSPATWTSGSSIALSVTYPVA